MTLEARGAGQTCLRYAAQAQVGGKLAQIGSRLVDAAAGAMADKFFSSFAQRLAAPVPPGGIAPAPRADAGWWGFLRALLRRLFGRR